MKLKIVIVDFEIPARVKRWALRIAIPAVVVGAAAVAFAAPTWTIFQGATMLTAQQLNDNFSILQGQITPLQTALSAANESEVVAYDAYGPGASAFGSIDTSIFRFKTELKSTGTAITHASTPASGDTFTVNEAGLYAIQAMSQAPAFLSPSFTSAGGGGTDLGISVNALATERSISILSIDITHKLIAQRFGWPANCCRIYPSVSGVYRLSVGDVVRAHGQPGDFAESAGPYPTLYFKITKVAPLF